MGIQLGRWDCPSCGQKGILGNVTSCPDCGSPRGEDVDFYLPEDADDINEEKLLKESNSGVDWTCDYCGSDNKATQTSCRSCGSSRSKSVINRKVKEYEPEKVPRKTEKKKPEAPPPAPPRKKMSLGKKILLFFCFIILTVVFIMWPRTLKVEVVKHSWERTIEIDNNRLVTEENWSIPSGGQLKNSFRALHHTDKVFDHYVNRTRTKSVVVGSERYKCGSRSKGNGYFEDKYCTRNKYANRTESYQEAIYRNVPVYKTKYTYTIYRWIKDHVINDKGTDKNVRWPKEDFPNDKWREGKRTEKYMLYYKDKKGNDYYEVVDFDFWNKAKKGQQLKAETNAIGSFYGVARDK
jgi:ribosomal protein L32